MNYLVIGLIVICIVAVGICYFSIRRIRKLDKQLIATKEEIFHLEEEMTHLNHAIKAFEILEGKIGEMQRRYEKKKNELENCDNAADIASILGGLHNK